jgi:hypothetical protein
VARRPPAFPSGRHQPPDRRTHPRHRPGHPPLAPRPSQPDEELLAEDDARFDYPSSPITVDIPLPQRAAKNVRRLLIPSRRQTSAKQVGALADRTIVDLRRRWDGEDEIDPVVYWIGVGADGRRARQVEVREDGAATAGLGVLHAVELRILRGVNCGVSPSGRVRMTISGDRSSSGPGLPRTMLLRSSPACVPC